MGPTGLLTSETDTNGAAGCDNIDNNFLAAVETQVGEQYLLGINNFSTDSSGLVLEICGTMVLSCDTISCSNLTRTKQFLVSDDFSIFPNPVSTDKLEISLGKTFAHRTQLQLYNLMRQLVYQTAIQQTTQIALPMTGLPPGSYILKLITNEAIGVKAMIRL